MFLDGHSALSVAERLGLSGPNALYRRKGKRCRRQARPLAHLGTVQPARRGAQTRGARAGHPKKAMAMVIVFGRRLRPREMPRMPHGLGSFNSAGSRRRLLRRSPDNAADRNAFGYGPDLN